MQVQKLQMVNYDSYTTGLFVPDESTGVEYAVKLKRSKTGSWKVTMKMYFPSNGAERSISFSAKTISQVNSRCQLGSGFAIGFKDGSFEHR